jgi:hypothetical protein
MMEIPEMHESIISFIPSDPHISFAFVGTLTSAI